MVRSSPGAAETVPDRHGLGPTDDAGERGPLSDSARAILDFERQWWRHPGSKDEAIRTIFDISANRYYQRLNALLDDPAALEHDPILVKRLRRLRERRTQERSARRLSGG
jgi:hypothetical protein